MLCRLCRGLVKLCGDHVVLGSGYVVVFRSAGLALNSGSEGMDF
jgi:hypothetical protein